MASGWWYRPLGLVVQTSRGPSLSLYVDMRMRCEQSAGSVAAIARPMRNERQADSLWGLFGLAGFAVGAAQRNASWIAGTNESMTAPNQRKISSTRVGRRMGRLLALVGSLLVLGVSELSVCASRTRGFPDVARSDCCSTPDFKRSRTGFAGCGEWARITRSFR